MTDYLHSNLPRSLKGALAGVYRRLLPRPVREPIWFGTRAAWAAFVLGNRREARYRLARCLVSCGRYRTVVSLSDDMRLAVDLRDEGVGQAIYATRTYEANETAVVMSQLRPGMTVLDIGANLGYYTVLCAKQVGPSGRVIAIEPDPHNFALLETNIRLNRLTNVVAINAAVGAEPGTATLAKSDTNFGDHRLNCRDRERQTVVVPVDTVDRIAERLEIERIGFIKMDVQGYEAYVIQGMSGLLRSGRIDAMLMEYWPFGIRQAGQDPREMLQLLCDADFEAGVIDRLGRLKRTEPFLFDSVLPPFREDEPDGCFINILLNRGGRRAAGLQSEEWVTISE